MGTIAKLDVTDRAIDGGWSLPEGWTVRADMSRDYDCSPEEFGCYTPAQVEAWRNDDWTYVYVSVWVEDAAGREWGHAGLGGTEYGDFVMTDEDDTVTGRTWIDPLNAPAGEYNVIREYDLINEALEDAVKALEEFGSPALVKTGDYSGL